MAVRRGVRPAFFVRSLLVVLGLGAVLVAVGAYVPVTPASAAGGEPGPADLNPPAGEILFPLPGTWTNYAYILVRVRFSDPDQIAPVILMDVDGYALTVYTSSISPTIVEAYATGPRVSDGPHTLNASASDRSGNGPTVLSWSVSVDTQLPVVAITSPVGNPVLVDGSVTLAWTGSDSGSGIDHYNIRLDDGPSLPMGMATSFPFYNLTPGVHYFWVTAEDVAGNTNDYDDIAVAIATVPSPPPASPPGPPGNTTAQITVVVPEGIPSWAIALVVINAVEAAAIAWVALRGRAKALGGSKPGP